MCLQSVTCCLCALVLYCVKLRYLASCASPVTSRPSCFLIECSVEKQDGGKILAGSGNFFYFVQRYLYCKITCHAVLRSDALYNFDTAMH